MIVGYVSSMVMGCNWVEMLMVNNVISELDVEVYTSEESDERR